MASATNKLSAKGAAALKAPGIYGDGGGLYIRIAPSGTVKNWVFIYTLGRRREMLLGAFDRMGLAEAREARDAARALVDAKVDPIEARKAVKPEPEPERVVPTFGQVADDLVDGLEIGWKNAKHRQQWRNTLHTYGRPIWLKPVDKVTTEDLLAILTPIWLTKPETAVRVRGRIERVLDAGKAHGHRDGENPARFRGHLALLLPSQKMGKKREHHPAMPYADVPAFMRTLRAMSAATAAEALEFTILTCVRSSETLLARAREFDLDAEVWTIPGERMKMEKEHRVPLAPAALAIARARLRKCEGPDDYVFPGRRAGTPLSNMAMGMILRRSQFDDYTVHGFRSSFRDWAGEETDFPREFAEMALAHAVGDRVERAYRRGDALAKRRELMVAWAGYLAGA